MTIHVWYWSSSVNYTNQHFTNLITDDDDDNVLLITVSSLDSNIYFLLSYLSLFFILKTSFRESEPVPVCTHMQMRGQRLYKHKCDGRPVHVRGSMARFWLWWMICQDVVQLPLYAEEGQPVRLSGTRLGTGGVMTACVLLGMGVGSRVNAPLNMSYFGNPQSHVSGTCRHYTSHWSGVKLWLKRQRAWGLNTTTPAVLMGKSMIFPLFLHFSCFEIFTSF